MKKSTLLIAIFGLFLPLICLSQPMVSPTKQQILDSASKQFNAPKMRGGMGATSRNMGVRASIDMVINFEFDSSELQARGANDLDQLVLALNDPSMSNKTFVIEGHTDAKGTEAYNIDLSHRRAQTVVSYLVSNGVSADKLASKGLGFSQLYYPQKPEAPENRRVRVIIK
jgi:outer membrane protein OmpA-like peptidoglycan-associated protein